MVNLIVPIYSMRSHIDNKYYLMKDGNLQLHLARYQEGDYLIVPRGAADLRELYKYVPSKMIFQMTYFENAAENRRRFWSYNGGIIDALVRQIGAQRIITDITGYKGPHRLVNNFNISWDPMFDRPYIDEFADSDAASIKKAEMTYVLNDVQIDNMVYKYPGLVSRTKMNWCQRVIKPSLLDAMSVGDPIYLEGTEQRPQVMFFPFRLSDKAYDWEGTLEMYKDYTIYITDPNESYDGTHDNVIVIKPSKNEYYRILKGRPVVRYNEKPQYVFHPGLAELMYFNVMLSVPPTSFLPNLNDLIITDPIWQDSY